MFDVTIHFIVIRNHTCINTIPDVLHAAVVREWHLGMKISTNGYLGIKEFYNDPCKCNETSTLEDLKAKGRQHYKSCLMRSLINVIQVRAIVVSSN